MEVTFTNEAINNITDKLGGTRPKFLFLDYDIEGCGCVMSGVTQLTYKDELFPGDLQIETNFLPLIIEEKYKVFFDEKMTIDYQAKYNAFQLKSPNQILNPRLSFLKK
jgi:uncharacterized protein YqkB